MPYIKPDQRSVYDLVVESLFERLYGKPTLTPGELNYLITRLVMQYIKFKGGISYTNCNEVIGVLECVKQELYRRIVAKYEDEKIAENGDVIDFLVGQT